MEDADTLVRLNVGGTWHTTTRNTLLSHPNAIFGKMLQEKSKKRETENSNKDSSPTTKEKGYFFIDRDGTLFRYVLNFMRSSKLDLPADFKEHNQLLSEARFYGLDDLVQTLNDVSTIGRSHCVEVIETAHPEKVGVCSARLIIHEGHAKLAPFRDVLERLPVDGEVYHGAYGRFWIRTNMARLDWAELLASSGWTLVGTTSFLRKLPDVTGQGTDLCHVVDKWSQSS